MPATATASAHGVTLWLMQVEPARMPFATSVEAAADALAFPTVDPSVEFAGGRSCGECRPIDSSPESHDAGTASRLRGLAAGLTRFDPLPHPGARA